MTMLSKEDQARAEGRSYSKLAELFGRPQATLTPAMETATGQVEQNLARLISQQGRPSVGDVGRSLLLSAAYRGAKPHTEFLAEDQNRQYQQLGAQTQMLSQLTQMRLQQAEMKAQSNPLAGFFRDSLTQILQEGPDGPDRANKIVADLEADQRPMTIQTFAETVAKYPAALTDQNIQTAGGLQRDPTTGEWSPIPGYLDMRAAEAELTRSPYQGPQTAEPQPYRMPDGSIRTVLNTDIAGQQAVINEGGTAISQGDVETSTQRERDEQILISGDPSSTEYAMAYHNQYGKPKYVPAADGSIVPIFTPPPAGIRPPLGATSPTGGSAPIAGTPIQGTGKKQPLPQDAQDNLKLAQSAVRQIRIFEDNISKSGPLEGRLRSGANIFGWGGIEEWEAARNNIKLAAQAIIKGIPSDFDVRTLENTLPDINLPENRNQARVQELKLQFQGLIRDAISFYQGKNYDIPAHVYQMAKEFGVAVDGSAASGGTLYYNPDTGKIE